MEPDSVGRGQVLRRIAGVELLDLGEFDIDSGDGRIGCNHAAADHVVAAVEPKPHRVVPMPVAVPARRIGIQVPRRIHRQVDRRVAGQMPWRISVAADADEVVVAAIVRYVMVGRREWEWEREWDDLWPVPLWLP